MGFERNDDILQRAKEEGIVILECWKRRKRRLKIYRVSLIAALFLSIGFLGFYTYLYYYNQIPGVWRVKPGEEILPDFGAPYTMGEPMVNAGGYSVSVKLLGIVPIKEVGIQVVDDEALIPAGIPVGLYVEFDGLLVSEVGSFVSLAGERVSPSKEVLMAGDYIETVNSTDVTTKEDFISYVEDSQGNALTLVIRRNGITFEEKVVPQKNEEGKYKIGIWVKDNAQGIGTLTYVDANGDFGALGHAIGDMDTTKELEIADGSIFAAKIVDIKMGEKGTPGEMTGMVSYNKSMMLGDVDENGGRGVFGKGNEKCYGYLSEDALPIGLKQEVTIGPAQIFCTIEDTPQYYDIEITRLHLDENHMNRGIEIIVTDPELLKLTGGIIQGMSGSPIIQDGKFVGAVTHVLVNDPTKGYGIFIEEMLEQ